MFIGKPIICKFLLDLYRSAIIFQATADSSRPSDKSHCIACLRFWKYNIMLSMKNCTYLFLRETFSPFFPFDDLPM